ncbi:probable beta-D-xylosidase 7 [Gigantopelta aegis]|uniref:probable beta-D-xylosidase 7 n=1 Tax=Gigantopelta aegis TaxID=1735272 RepID=UPI001B88E5CC|nr:probable beta-D-xylosidase 7 [Gigantopelta aegis]
MGIISNSVKICIAIALMSGTNVADYPFRNTSLPWKDRVDDLVSRLTVEEIKEQMSRAGEGPKGGPAPAIPRLGIKPYSWDTECLRGDAFAAGNATAFPQALGLAATFSSSVIFSVAKAVGTEIRAKNNDYVKRGMYGDYMGISCFSPVINIMRDPRWGRNQETYGEDPILSGMLAESFVKGLQGNNSRFIRANAGCKHFDVHGGPENIPVSRFSFDAKVSERDWRTTFLPQFKACVKAGTYSLMCSYNSINGVPSCANSELLTKILRYEWNFTGYVVSDESAVENIISQHHYLNTAAETAAACINAGCSLEVTSNDADPVFYSMIDAIKQGILTEDVVRDRVKPLFYTRMRLGEFDPPDDNPYTKLDLSVVQSKAHQELALKAAMQSFVLLKNKNGFLPLKKTVYDKIAIIGPMANNIKQQFGDYTSPINPAVTTTPLQSLSELGKDVHYAAGCDSNACTQYNSRDIQKAVTEVEVIFACLGTGEILEREQFDRADLEWPGKQLQVLQDAVKYGKGAPLVVFLFNAGPLNLTWAYNNDDVSAMFEVFFPAQATGEAMRRILINQQDGDVPAGRLPNTWPKYIEDVPPITDYTMEGRTYRYFKGEVYYPFGFGLSYTTFKYVAMIYPVLVKAGQNMSVSIVVKNTGNYDADEVVQVYIWWQKASVPVPQLQLVYVDRVRITRRKSVDVEFTIPAERLAVWHDAMGWVIEEGSYGISCGGQQPNQKVKVNSNVITGEFTVTGTAFLGMS